LQIKTLTGNQYRLQGVKNGSKQKKKLLKEVLKPKKTPSLPTPTLKLHITRKFKLTFHGLHSELYLCFKNTGLSIKSSLIDIRFHCSQYTIITTLWSQ